MGRRQLIWKGIKKRCPTEVARHLARWVKSLEDVLVSLEYQVQAW
jgi:hypothetical protein